MIPGKDLDLELKRISLLLLKLESQRKKLADLGEKLSTLPEGKKYFRKISKIFKERLKGIQEDKLDWGAAEMLAYATLLEEGHPVRVSGQDVERGTFSHRHAVVKTEDTEEEIITLNLLSDKQAPFTIYNSFLSEYGVLGFEYGYSLATPNGLTIWEAQFGDFYNGSSNHGRSIYHGWRRQMVNSERFGNAASSWLRRTRSRTFKWSNRTILTTMCRFEYSNCEYFNTSKSLPCFEKTSEKRI